MQQKVKLKKKYLKIRQEKYFNINKKFFSPLLRLIRKKIKNIYFIIGSDNLIRFHKWKSWKKIVKLVKLIVFSRNGYDKKGMKSTVVKNFKNKIIFIKNKPISISSTQLKKQTKLNI